MKKLSLKPEEDYSRQEMKSSVEEAQIYFHPEIKERIKCTCQCPFMNKKY